MLLQRVVALFLCLSLLPGGVIAAPAPADVERYLIAAKRLYEDLEYERSLEQLQRAKKASTQLETDVAIALYEGVLRAELRQQAEAEAAFKTGLLLNPDAPLPVKVSPKVRALFERTRVEARQEVAALRARQPPTPAPTTTPRVIPASRVETSAPRPFPVVPMTLLGVAVVAVGTGVVFGVRANRSADAARQAEFQDVARRYSDTARDQARAANIGYAAAGVTAAAALVVYLLTRPKDAPP